MKIQCYHVVRVDRASKFLCRSACVFGEEGYASSRGSCGRELERNTSQLTYLRRLMILEAEEGTTKSGVVCTVSSPVFPISGRKCRGT